MIRYDRIVKNNVAGTVAINIKEAETECFGRKCTCIILTVYKQFKNKVK